MTDDYKFPRVNRESYKPIYVQVAEMIIAYAQHQGLKPGDALPSENQLLAMLDVSRNSIRQAVERLVQMNFAVKRRGQGTFIKPWKPNVRLDFSQGFEGSLHKLGLEIENRLIKLEPLSGPQPWAAELASIAGEEITHVRRVKLVQGTLVALEDRLLPSRIVKRYTRQEFERENVNPTLLERFPDTVVERFTYHFSASPLTKVEAESLGLAPGEVLLQRVGEYFIRTGECIMHGRHIFSTSRFNVSYEFEHKDGRWMLT